MSGELTHLDETGAVRMVDVSAKPVSLRTAEACGFVRLQPRTLRLIEADEIAKGNVLATARIAGIQAAKRTSEIIPLCHPLPLSGIEVHFDPAPDGMRIRCAVKTTAQTGVEMEALTGVAAAALAVYDMCKAADKAIVIDEIRLVSKTKQ